MHGMDAGLDSENSMIGSNVNSSTKVDAKESESFSQIYQKVQWRAEMYNSNISVRENIRIEELDSTIKKNHSIMKKLKAINDDNKNSIENELCATNISQFIPEFAQTISEAKYKLGSVKAVVSICSKTHQRYSDFSTHLNERMKVALEENLNRLSTQMDCINDLRNSLRLYCELYFCGVISKCTSFKYVMEMIKKIIKSDDQNCQNSPAIVSAVLKECSDALGFFPEGYCDYYPDFDSHSSQLLSSSQKIFVRKFFNSYYDSLLENFLSLHKKLSKLSSKTTEIYALRGDLPSDLEDKYLKYQKLYDNLFCYVRYFSDCLCLAIPNLDYAEESFIKVESSVSSKSNPPPPNNNEDEVSTNENNTNNLWGDEETKYFYENFIDISLYTSEVLERKKLSYNEWMKQFSGPKSAKSSISKSRTYASRVPNNEKSEDSEDEFEDEAQEEIVISKEERSQIPSTSNELFARLANCINRELVDEIAKDFVTNHNTKVVRKLLVQEMYHVKFTRLDLLPFFGRLIATLHSYYPEIGFRMVFLLKKQVIFHMKQRLHFNLESKIRTVRFLGELTKFRICPKSDCLWILKHLLQDFVHHNIHMACNLIDSCGSFLYMSPESKKSLLTCLDQLKRKSQVAVLDEYLKILVENAICCCFTSSLEKNMKPAKNRSDLNQYFTKVIREDLSKHSVENILKLVRKCNFQQEDIVHRLKVLIVKVWKIKYSNISCVANLLSGLYSYQPNFVHDVIDYLSESIRTHLETNNYTCHQKMISTTKFLGELYDFGLIDSDVIFRTLYLFISLGYSLDGIPQFDDSTDFFRIRLVVCLLETCFRYFENSSDQEKLGIFLLIFQAYVWMKRINYNNSLLRPDSHKKKKSLMLPSDIEFLLEDLIDMLKYRGNYFLNISELQLAVSDCLTNLFSSSSLSNIVTDIIYPFTWLPKFLNFREESLDNISKSTLIESHDSSLSINLSVGVETQCTSENSNRKDQGSSSFPETLDSEFQKLLEDSIKENHNSRISEDIERAIQFDLRAPTTEQSLFNQSSKIKQCNKNEKMKKLLTPKITDSISVDTPLNSGLNITDEKIENQAIIQDDSLFDLRIMTKKSNKQIYLSTKIPKSSQIASKILRNQIFEQKQKNELKQVILNMSSRFVSNDEF